MIGNIFSNCENIDAFTANKFNGYVAFTHELGMLYFIDAPFCALSYKISRWVEQRFSRNFRSFKSAYLGTFWSPYLGTFWSVSQVTREVTTNSTKERWKAQHVWHFNCIALNHAERNILFANRWTAMQYKRKKYKREQCREIIHSIGKANLFDASSPYSKLLMSLRGSSESSESRHNANRALSIVCKEAAFSPIDDNSSRTCKVIL